MFKLAVCDDEELILNHIINTIKREITICDKEVLGFSDGNSLIKVHRNNPFDAIFLDINIPQQCGFSIAKDIRNASIKQPAIIFVTSHDELVYNSFDFQPFGFIRKNPFERMNELLIKQIHRLISYIGQNEIIEITLPYNNKRLIRIRELIYIKSEKNYLKYHLINLEEVYIREKLDYIEDLMKRYDFIRVHNRYLISLHHIKKIDEVENKVYLVNETSIKISRSYKKAVIEKYLTFSITF